MKSQRQDLPRYSYNWYAKGSLCEIPLPKAVCAVFSLYQTFSYSMKSTNAKTCDSNMEEVIGLQSLP